MNDEEAAKQIEKMVRFILLEAEEKAREIKISAEDVRYFPSYKNTFLNLNRLCRR